MRVSTAQAALLAGGWAPVGALVVVDGSVPVDRVVARLAERADLVPALRRRVVAPLGGLGGRWLEDDPLLDVAAHVVAAPAPRGTLEEWVADALEHEPDPARPPWLLHVTEVTGPDGSPSTALLSLVHRGLLDRTDPLDVLALLGDGHAPTAAAARAEPVTAPGAGEVVRAWAGEAARVPLRAADAVAGVAVQPSRALLAGREAADLAYRTFRRAVRSTPDRGPWHVDAGGRVELSTAVLPLSELRRGRDATGHEVGDVLVAVVVDALARLLGPSVPASVRVMAPVAVEQPLAPVVGELGPDGPSVPPGAAPDVAAALVPVPTGGGHVDRLDVVAGATARLGGAVPTMPIGRMAGVARTAPSLLHAAAQALAAGPVSYDVLVSNVPGPDRAVRLFGRPVAAVHPVLPPVAGHAVAVAATSLHGRVHVTLTAARGAVPDVAAFGALLPASLDDLLGELGRPGGGAGRRAASA